MPSRTGSSLLLFLTCHLKISNFRLKLLKIEVCLNFSFIAAFCPDVSCVVGGVVLGHHHCLLWGVVINFFFKMSILHLRKVYICRFTLMWRDYNWTCVGWRLCVTSHYFTTLRSARYCQSPERSRGSASTHRTAWELEFNSFNIDTFGQPQLWIFFRVSQFQVKTTCLN